MSIPFYVSPEQIIKDKADFARKGIARGRSVVVMQYDAGILLVAENPSRALHKISEIYDRIAFAAVGKYNEFESLRVAGIRLADLRGYSYDRSDVTCRSLANAYATTLGTIFTETQKPYEVEIVVAEVGSDQATDQMYRLTFDGSVADEHGFVAMGGSADRISAALHTEWREGLPLGEAIRISVAQLGAGGVASVGNASAASGSGASTAAGRTEPRELSPAQLEVAVLDRNRPRRKFRRIGVQELTEMLRSEPEADSGEPDSAAAKPQTKPTRRAKPKASPGDE